MSSRGARRWPALVALLAATLAVAQGAAPAAAPTATQRSADDRKAYELFAKVIAFRTSVGENKVPALLEYLAGEFRAAGFPEADIRILPLGDTASMVVRYRGDGSGGRPILLMSHADVVTANHAEWRTDPFTLTERDGFYFGRGTVDVKTGLVAQMATLLRMKAAGVVPTRDLIMMVTGDEEETEATAADLTAKHRDLIEADFALNADAGNGTLDEKTGKPLFFSLGTAEKGYASYEVTVRNIGGHSSEPRADNAIYDLAGALRGLQAFRFPLMWNDTTLAYFRGIGELTPGPLGAAMRRFGHDPHDASAADELAGNSKYVGMTRTTCIPTLLRGGHAENALPEFATATINCRTFPGVKPEEVRAALQSAAGSGAEVKAIGAPAETNASPLRADVLQAVTRALHVRYPGVPVIPMQESGMSDAFYTRGIGIPSYGVSTGFIKDSDNHMHGSNEGIPVDSFYNYLAFWNALLTDLATRPRH